MFFAFIWLFVLNFFNSQIEFSEEIFIFPNILSYLASNSKHVQFYWGFLCLLFMLFMFIIMFVCSYSFCSHIYFPEGDIILSIILSYLALNETNMSNFIVFSFVVWCYSHRNPHMGISGTILIFPIILSYLAFKWDTCWILLFIAFILLFILTPSVLT